MKLDNYFNDLLEKMTEINLKLEKENILSGIKQNSAY